MTSTATSAARSRSPQGRNLPHQFISTWNNYTDADIDKFRAWCELRTHYSIVGREVGEEGTPHLQGFHQTSGGLSFPAFKKKFPSVHVKRVFEDNGCSEYCSKDGKVCISTGEYQEKTPGRRTDLLSVAEMAKSGKSMAEIAELAPAAIVQYPSGIARLCTFFEKPRDRSVAKRCICLWGESEVHKTRRIWDHLDALGVTPYVWENGMPTWWDGYHGQKHVIMDEYRAHLPMSVLLRLMDRYPMRVQFKGGSCQFVADFLYFTSSCHPKDWYKDLPDDKVYQLVRRFEHITHVNSPDQRVVVMDAPAERS